MRISEILENEKRVVENRRLAVQMVSKLGGTFKASKSVDKLKKSKDRSKSQPLPPLKPLGERTPVLNSLDERQATLVKNVSKGVLGHSPSSNNILNHYYFKGLELPKISHDYVISSKPICKHIMERSSLCADALGQAHILSSSIPCSSIRARRSASMSNSMESFLQLPNSPQKKKKKTNAEEFGDRQPEPTLEWVISEVDNFEKQFDRTQDSFAPPKIEDLFKNKKKQKTSLQKKLESSEFNLRSKKLLSISNVSLQKSTIKQAE